MVSVLVIDDNLSSRDFLRDILQDQGLQVLCACDGSIGLTMAQEQVPDLIIADLHMPGLNGLEMIQQLQNGIKTRSIPCILCTSETSQDCCDRALQLGAAYIAKPFRVSRLINLVMGQLDCCEARNIAS